MLRKLTSRWFIAFGIAVAVMTGSVVAVNLFIDSKLSSVRRVAVKTAPSPPQGGNYLLLASDHQTIDDLADTMMVIHIEPGVRKTLIVSFPRDLWVNIPGQGMAKINAASSGGPNRVVQTLKADFGIDINHFIFMNFKSFQGVVDAIGRVPVYFPYPARDPLTGLGVKFGGCQTLDGLTALQYTRSRALQFLSFKDHQWHTADQVAPDIGRIARQQQFIRELASIAVQRSLQDPITANTVVDRVLQYLTLDQGLSKSDVFSVIDAFRSVNPNDSGHLEFQTLPWKGGPDQGGQSVLYVKEPDDQPLLARLRDFSGKDTSTSGGAVSPKSVSVQVVDGTGRGGTGQGVINDLVQRIGYRSAGAVVVARRPSAHTEVRYKPGAFAKGQLVLGNFAPNTRLVEDNTGKGDVTVVLGNDFRTLVVSSGARGGTPPSTTRGPAAAAPSPGDSTAQTATGSAIDVAVFGTPVPKAPPCR